MLGESLLVREEILMKSEKLIVGRLSIVGRALVRGRVTFNLLIFVLVCIFFVHMVISVGYNIFFQQDLEEKTDVQNIRAVGSVLARATEALLAADEISMLRRAIAEAGLEHGLDYCRIVLPDGEILADSDPKKITMLELPESWTSPRTTYTEKYDRRCAMLSFPLEVPGRGSASLEIAGRIAKPSFSNIESQTAQMTIACLALVVMLLVHHHVRPRLKAIDTIHEALREMKPAKSDISTLEIDPRLGTEALAWNKIVRQSQGQQIRATIDRVKESLRQRSEINVELAAACDALPYGLIVIGERMFVDYANGAAATLLQTKVDEIRDRDISQFITDQRVIEAIGDAAESPVYKRTVVEVQQDSPASSSVLRFMVRPIRKEDLGVAVVMIEDITQQRMAEEARSSFLASAAHELRTPLTNIRLCAEGALEDSEHNSAATMKYLNVVNDESHRLERTVSGILSVAEVEAGSFTLVRDDVHLDVLLKQLKADHEAQAREKHITLEFDIPPKLPVLHADRDKILLALHNLLGNALKYTPERNEVSLKAMQVDGQIHIAVSDTGIGMTPEDAEHIFDKFYRASDERVKEVTGSGLGLAIARQVVRQHGGDITVETKLNKGSTFTLTLPVATEEVT
jgi:signal transduction histidine kinase